MNYVVTVQTGSVRQIEKVEFTAEKPIVVGRAFDSDVVVDDDYMDARHVEFALDDEGRVLVRDLDTQNGTLIAKKNIGEARVYDFQSEIFSGESTITLHKLDAEVAPALKRETVHAIERKFGSVLWTLIATVVASAGIVLSVTLVEFDEVNKQLLVDSFLMVGVAVLCWCLFAGVIGKLFRHKSYLKLHWSLSCVVFGVSAVFSLLADVLSFNLDSSFWHVVLGYISVGLAVWLLIYGTLSLSTRLRMNKKIIASTLMAVFPAVVGSGVPMLAEDHENWTELAYVARVNQPPALLFRQPTSLVAHIENTEALFTQLDREVELSGVGDSNYSPAEPEPPSEIVVSESDQ